MALTTCPKGHPSTDPDFCSECGTRMTGAPSALPPTPGPLAPGPTSATGGDLCPSCGIARDDPSARFCENCRYDFVHGAASPPPPSAVVAPTQVAAPGSPSAAAPVAAPGSPASAAPASSAGALVRGWEAVVAVDPSLDVDPDPALPCPQGEPERTYPIDLAENLIGRRDDRQDIHPEVPVRDPAVSRRHAKVLRQPDGSLALLDVGSANGTRLNGVDLVDGVRTPLNDGDVVEMGRWTRITIRALR